MSCDKKEQKISYLVGKEMQECSLLSNHNFKYCWELDLYIYTVYMHIIQMK